MDIIALYLTFYRFTPRYLVLVKQKVVEAMVYKRFKNRIFNWQLSKDYNTRIKVKTARKLVRI